MAFDHWFTKKYPQIPLRGALVVLKLAAEGSTVPFIARYRKEQTGNLDEVAVANAIDAKKYWDDLQSRKEFVLAEIDSQGKLTPELRQAIEDTDEINIVEDLYLPYKKKRKTKATIAKEAGLEPLAEWIWACGHGSEESLTSLAQKASEFINKGTGIESADAAITGAQDILIERLAEMADLRQTVRTQIFEHGVLTSTKGEKAKEHSKYENYFEFHEAIGKLRLPQNSHRYLAMRRGEAEGELRLSIGGVPGDETFEMRLLAIFEDAACTEPSSAGAAVLKLTARIALNVYVMSSIAAEAHSALHAVADEAAIKVFAENIKTVLLAAPFGAHTVLGVDPGIRTGCKLALVNASGAYVSSAVISPSSSADREHLGKLLQHLSKNAALKAIAVGNGTAGRETETFFRQLIDELKLSIPVVMVSESGASIYSASAVAREEFPELDLTIRGAISIARRLQDPLAELVKTDPKSIGVGQYQHDVSPGALKSALERVVESSVNSVGVSLNTASYHLLAYVSGVGEGLAKSIVEYRGKNGLFKSRKKLLDVPRFGPKAFEQAAGFLRIAGAENPLDNTGVHPERYEALESYASSKGQTIKELIAAGASSLKNDASLKEKLGPFTFADVVQELEKPGRDPREQFTTFEFSKDIHELADLKEGLICPGIVTNVTNFGAFVDIGVHQDGLVHISQLSDSFVSNPAQVVHPGERVQVRVLSVNIEKKQISLSMKKDSPSTTQSAPRRDDAPPRQNQPKHNERGRGPREEEFKNNPFAALGAAVGAKPTASGRR